MVDVCGDAFQALSGTMRLWTDQIAEEEDLPLPVRQALQDRIDGLSALLHEKPVEMPRKKRTPSMEAEVADDDE